MYIRSFVAFLLYVGVKNGKNTCRNFCFDNKMPLSIP